MADRLARRLSQALERRPEIVVAYLFGSAARGTSSALSDVDVAVLAVPPPSNSLRYRAKLSEDLTRAAEKTVQVVLMNEANPALAERVIRERHVLLCRDETERMRLEIRTLERYLDTVHLRRQLNEELSAAIRERRFYG